MHPNDPNDPFTRFIAEFLESADVAFPLYLFCAAANGAVMVFRFDDLGEVEFVCKRDVGSPSVFTLPIMLVAIAEDGSGAAPAFIRKGEGGMRLTPVH